MITYLIKSAGCLLTLLTVYHLLLEKEKSLRFNRAWLLLSLLFSFAIPFLPLPLDWLPASKIPVLSHFSLPTTAQSPVAVPVVDQTARATPAYVSWMVILYDIITAFWLVRFSRNLYLVLHRISSHPRVRLEEARLVLLGENYVPHTFGNTIFLNEKAWYDGAIDKEILTHELAHARQLHTLDILVLEVLRIFFWFNPLLILYKRAMQLNHEFLADEAVIETFHNPKQYQQLLFQLVALRNPSSLSSPLNYHITKKRLIMITRHTPKNGWVKNLATIPLLMGVIIFFSTSIDAQKTVQQTDNVAYTDRMVMGTENLGANPYVLIDGKPYPSDILTRISSGCIASSSIWSDKEAKTKYGPAAADGAVILTLNKQGLTYATATERENLALERSANSGFYYRLRLKQDDGTPYDRLILKDGTGQMTADGKADCKVAFIIDDKLYTEAQLDELQRRLKTLKPAEVSLRSVPKSIPGVDLSGYEVIFYFDSASATPNQTR
jgi:BlaR1 peptidase M56